MRLAISRGDVEIGMRIVRLSWLEMSATKSLEPSN